MTAYWDERDDYLPEDRADFYARIAHDAGQPVKLVYGGGLFLVFPSGNWTYLGRA